MKILILFSIIILPVALYSQSTCLDILKQGEAALVNDSTELALKKLQDAETCDYKNELQNERQTLQLKIFDAIIKKREEAENAQEATKVALQEKEEANRATQEALDSLIKANKDRVNLILIDANRQISNSNFLVAFDRIKSAELLGILEDSISVSKKNLSLALLKEAQAKVSENNFNGVLMSIDMIRDLDMFSDSIDLILTGLRTNLLKNVSTDIVNMDYNSALSKLDIAIKAETSIDTLLTFYQEIIFVLGEIGQYNKVKSIVDSILWLIPDSADIISSIGLLTNSNEGVKLKACRSINSKLNDSNYKKFIYRYYPLEMIAVSGGTFLMGDALGEGEKDEYPHNVTIDDFHLNKNEITFYQYSLFCYATGLPIPNDEGWGIGERPVINVSWFNAIWYCEWLNLQLGLNRVYYFKEQSQKEFLDYYENVIRDQSDLSIDNYLFQSEFDGNPAERIGENIKVEYQKFIGNTNIVRVDWNSNGFRLPTEAEWEYAARGKGKKLRYAWDSKINGNVADETLRQKFNSWKIFENYSDGYVFTAPTNIFLQGDLGFCDLTGNVWEWCWDWYDKNYYRRSEGDKNPVGPNSGVYKILRGGSWDYIPTSCRIAFRNGASPLRKTNRFGFRVASTKFTSPEAF